MYGRTFGLDAVPTTGLRASRLERLPVLLGDAVRKVRLASDSGFHQQPWGRGL